MESGKQARYAWMAYAAICIMAVMWTGIQYNCMNLYAAPVVEEMGITRTQFMVVLSIPAVISATVSLLCFGAIEERFGMRRMLLVGGILNTLAFTSWFFMNSVAMLYLGGVLYGCGCSITAYNSVAAGVNRWFKQRMGSLMGGANALGNVAGIVFAMVIAAIIATVGWRYSFGICVVLSAVSTAACVALYRGNPDDVGVRAMYEDAAGKPDIAAVAEGADGETAAPCDLGDNRAEADWEEQARGAAPGAPGESDAVQRQAGIAATTRQAADGMPFRAALRMPRLWLLVAGYFLLGLTTYGIMSTLPLFAVDLGFEQLQGQVVSTSLLAAAIMMVPLGVICDKLGTKWGLALCGLAVAVAAAMLRMPGLPFAGMLAVAALSGAAYSACGVAVGTGVKEAFGQVEFSKKLGVCSGGSYIGLAAGPALINLAYDAAGTYSLALAVYAALAVAMAALFFAGLRPARAAS